MAKTIEQTPAALGYSMPAAWEKHEATWLGWPHNENDWPDKIDTIRWVYGEMVRKISEGELVRILVNSRAEAKFAASYLKRANCKLRRVQMVGQPTPEVKPESAQPPENSPLTSSPRSFEAA